MGPRWATLRTSSTLHCWRHAPPQPNPYLHGNNNNTLPQTLVNSMLYKPSNRISKAGRCSYLTGGTRRGTKATNIRTSTTPQAGRGSGRLPKEPVGGVGWGTSRRGGWRRSTRGVGRCIIAMLRRGWRSGIGRWRLGWEKWRDGSEVLGG